MNSWQVSQIFLSETGVHEVEIHLSTSKLRCNCPGFSSRRNCKHTRFVKSKMENNDGIYPVEVSSKLSKFDTAIASKDPEAFRRMLINFGRIEAI